MGNVKTVAPVKKPAPNYAPTHKELVERARRWLKGTKGCAVVISELHTAAGEIPDAIGFKGGVSILVECKTSRVDFLKDAMKVSRRAGSGMGRERYYLVPEGLVKHGDVPPHWGLLVCSAKTITVVKQSKGISAISLDGATKAVTRQGKEIMLLVSALRRAEEGKKSQ